VKRLPYYELEDMRRTATKKLWLAIAITAVSAVMSCAVAAFAMIQPTPVIQFDAEGRVVRFTEHRDVGMEGHRIWIEDTILAFLDKWIAVDSTRLEEDFQASLNMLAPQLREIVLREGEAAKYRSQFMNLAVRSHLVDVEVKFNEVAPSDKLIHFYAWGAVWLGPLGALPSAGSTQSTHFRRRWFLAKGILGRRPISSGARRGLVVEQFSYDLADSAQGLETLKIKLMKDG
jgi:hypothetical protein